MNVRILMSWFCLLVSGTALGGSEFAAEVVDFQGAFDGLGYYDNPQAVLGKPAVWCRNSPFSFPPGTAVDPNFRVKMVEPAYYLSVEGYPVITSIFPDEWIVVQFDHKVLDYPGNPYGQDFIVFGNAGFEYEGAYVGDGADLNTLRLAESIGSFFERIEISVSQDGQTWYSYDPNRMDPNDIRFADGLYPTQAYAWDRENACWRDEEMDFTLPVDPNLKPEDFAGLTVADAIDLYRGSGGGTPYDLRDLPDFEALSIDPETGCRWIRYVRLEGGNGPEAVGGEVDAISDVAGCGDPLHPYPAGDLNEDCRVNLEDVRLLSSRWLAAGDLEDLTELGENWLTCTYRCR